MATITTTKKTKNATKPLVLNITDDHVKRASCKDPDKCVIAQAIRDSNLGDLAEEMHVGSSCTKVVLNDCILRYKTPSRLAAALRVFDESNGSVWHLPPGEYRLMPYTAAQRRWESARRKGGKQSKFKKVISAPTRITKTIQQLGGS